jgi:hypothetical protein
MPYTKEQIKDYALALEAKGAPASEIEAFVSSAAKEMTDAPAAAPAPAPVKRVVEPPPQNFFTAAGNLPPKRTPERSAELGRMTQQYFDPRGMEQGMAKLGTAAARMAPAAIAMAAPPVGIAGWLGLGAAGYAGNMVARQTEGQNPYTRAGVADDTKSGILSGMPFPALKTGTSLIKSGLQAVKFGAAAAGTEASAESLRRSIEQGRIATYDNMAQGLKGVALPSIFGVGAGGSAAFMGTLGKKGEMFADNRQRMADVGVQEANTTFAMLDPGMAKWEQHVAQRNPALQIKIGQAHSDITKNFYRAIGDAGSNTEIASRLNPLVARVDAAEMAFQNAEKAHQAALANFQKASEAVGGPSVPASRPEDYYRRLDYSDVSGTARDISANGKQYAAELAKFDDQAVNNLAGSMRSAFSEAAGKLGIPVGINGKSQSWAMWDAGKQLHMTANPAKSSEKYRLGDPFSDVGVQADIVDRMLGYEITQGMGANGERLHSWQLTEVGRKARADAGVDLSLKPVEAAPAGHQAKVIDSAYSKIKAEVVTDLLTTISNKASKIYEGNAVVGFDLMTNTEKAAQLTGVVGELFDARTAIAKELYKDTKIPLNQPLFPKEDLVKAATAGMAGRTETGNAGKIIQVIKGAGKDPTSPYLSLAEFQELRAKMSDAFVSTGNNDQNALNIAESLASRAYKAMGDASKGTIRASFGDEVLTKYDAAQKFWRDTSEARDSALGRSLLQRGDILDTTITSMASGIAAGNVDELTQYKKFVGYIGEMSGINTVNPGIAQVANQHMAEALKNAFIVKHSKGGTLNADALLSDLMSGTTFKNLPFRVENLGFGSVETIKQWRKVVREFKPGQVNEQVMNDVLTDPKVQEVLAVGGKDADVTIREATARKIFDTEVNKATAAKYAEQMSAATRAKTEAEDIARRMKWNRDETHAAFERARQDPVLSAFSGKGKWNLTDEMAKTGEKTVTGLVASMDPQTARGLMNGLRGNDPQLAELVERRILSDEFKKLSGKDPKIPGSSDRLDLTKVDQYFNPLIDPNNSRIRFLENTVSKDTLDRFKTLATKLSKIDADAKAGKFPSDKELQHVVDTVSAGMLLGGSTMRPGLTMVILGKVRDMLSTGAYHTLSAVLANPKLGDALLDPNIGSLSEAIGSLPTQKAYLLANDAAIQGELTKLETMPSFQSRKPQVAPPPQPPAAPPEQAPAPPPAAPPQKTVQFQEGRLYLDPKTGARRRYKNGAFV